MIAVEGKTGHYLRRWQDVPFDEITASNLAVSQAAWCRENLQAAREFIISWLRNNNPPVSQADVDQAERDMQQYGDWHRKIAEKEYDHYVDCSSETESTVKSHRHGIADDVTEIVELWIDELRYWARDKVVEPIVVSTEQEHFAVKRVMTELEKEVWEALEGVFLTEQEILDKISGKRGSIRGTIWKMNKNDHKILNRPGRGYFRPDRPPPGVLGP